MNATMKDLDGRIEELKDRATKAAVRVSRGLEAPEVAGRLRRELTHCLNVRARLTRAGL